MEKTKILFVSQEITPYLPESEISVASRHLSQKIQEQGKEIRTFMPKFGCINERRNQLHEVIRLSGMNLIVNEADRPLILKVASIQSIRLQVYFIDNEDYFYRKSILTDENGNFFHDNDERAIFFARGVLETVKKLGWSPDIIHCHGWFTSLIPILTKKSYHENPMFTNAKIIYSIYNDEFSGKLNSQFKKKLNINSFSPKEASMIQNSNYVNISKLAVNYSDGIIIGSNLVNPELYNHILRSDKPVLEPNDPEKIEELVDTYSEFYDKFINQECNE